jgi:two-component system chemotaxis response regulator CheB
LAIEAGALAAVEKPSASPQDEAKRDEFLQLLRLMARVRVIRRNPNLSPPVSLPSPIRANLLSSPELIVIGASAGGPGALVQILGKLPENFPIPILVVQHLSADFVPGFADWLSRRCKMRVRIPIQGDLPTAGEIWIAPGGKHMSLSIDGRVMLHSDKGNHRHQPSIDILFEGVSKVFGKRAIGILLTGMGDDGAEGLEMLYRQGARTIAQDEATSVVFGMPAAAIERQAAEYVLPIHQIGTALLDLVGYHRLNSQL